MSKLLSFKLIIILLFYFTYFNTKLITSASDSWLWPNEVDSETDEHQSKSEEPVLSFNDESLTLRQEGQGMIIYQDSPLLVAVQQPKRNSTTWQRLDTAKKPADGSAKPFGGSFGASRTQLSMSNKSQYTMDLHKRPIFSGSGWNFPEEKTKRKSDLKCAEYSRIIEEKEVWVLPLVGARPTALSTTKTGRNKCKGVHNPLIVGGVFVRQGEFSHMAALGWISPNNGASFLCGGSLISDRWVITAAHCTHGPSGAPKVVRVGARRLGDETAGKLIKVREIVRHPSYKPPAVYADLALLELDETVKFGADVKPACLYTEFDSTPLQVWATGWGITGIGEEQSDKLLKTRLNVVDNVECALQLNRSAAIPRGVVPSMLCAGDISGDWQSDTCQGDSGGPLQILHPKHNCLYQIIGITSFGRLCALKNSPGVYTRISHYLDWIEKTVWPEKTR